MEGDSWRVEPLVCNELLTAGIWRVVTPEGRFIAKRGEGLHHVAYKVDDVAQVLTAVREAGLETIDTKPRSGGDGRTRVGFLDPKSTMGVLTELEEDA